jgi:hypothetical protein
MTAQLEMLRGGVAALRVALAAIEIDDDTH